MGRAPWNDIIIEDPFVSQQHVVFIAEDSEVWVQDLSTAHGVYVTRNNKKERIEEPLLSHKLQEGDLIEIGRHQITFRKLKKGV